MVHSSCSKPQVCGAVAHACYKERPLSDIPRTFVMTYVFSVKTNRVGCFFGHESKCKRLTYDMSTPCPGFCVFNRAEDRQLPKLFISYWESLESPFSGPDLFSETTLDVNTIPILVSSLNH